MTIFYPDLSHYDLDRGVTVEPGTVAVIAKATHGTLFLDRGYATIRQQALNVGAVFAGYHWLNHGTGAAQADYYYSQVGPTPCMVDAEDMPGNTGYSGPLTIADIVDFVTRLRARGGICNLVYLPRWVWDQHMGGPSLQPLKDLGVGLVSSNYTTYSDTGPGWGVYVRDNGAVEPSGMRPIVWQYTDALPYGGSTCDFNAFRGTLDQFRALITGGTPDMTPDESRLLVNSEHLLTQWGQGAATVTVDYGNNNKPTLVNPFERLKKDLLAAIPAPGQPTQDQVDSAVAKTMNDPDWLAKLGAAVASHIHVN